MEVEEPGPSGRRGAGDVWAGWVPAAKEEPTAAELKQKIRAKKRAGGCAGSLVERKALFSFFFSGPRSGQVGEPGVGVE